MTLANAEEFFYKESEMNIFLNILLVLIVLFILIRLYIIFGVAKNNRQYNYNIKDSGRNNKEIAGRIVSTTLAIAVLAVVSYFRFFH